MSSGGNSWVGGKGRSAQQGENYTRVAQKKKKKKKKGEIQEPLENKEKGFFFFFFFSAPGAALSSRTAQHAFSTFPRKASLEEFVGIGNGRFFSSVE